MFSFNGWDATETDTPQLNATYFAIVIGFANITAGSNPVIRYCSLNMGDIASPPAPMNAAQILQGLQYYYETNYPQGAAASGANTTNILIQPMSTFFTINGSGNVTSYGIEANSIGLQWQAMKRKAPSVSLISGAGAAGNVSLTYRINNAEVGPTNTSVATFWTQTGLGTKGVYYKVTQTNAMVSGPVANISSYVSFNYTADARFGIVN